MCENPLVLVIKPYNTFMLHRYRLKVKLEANKITQIPLVYFQEKPGKLKTRNDSYV